MSATEIQALVAAWNSDAINRDTVLHHLRTGEILPPFRIYEQEIAGLSGLTPTDASARRQRDD